MKEGDRRKGNSSDHNSQETKKLKEQLAQYKKQHSDAAQMSFLRVN